MKVLQVTFEWDLGLPKLYKDKETFLKYIEDFDFESNVDRTFEEIEEDGLVFYEEHEVVQ